MAELKFSSWMLLKMEEKTKLRRSRRRREKFREHKGSDYVGTIEANGYLVSPKGDVWPVRTGPHGRGALPDDVYDIGWPVGRDRINPQFHNSWRDGRGNIWFASLKNDRIRRETGRSGFGIHPDGGTPGTMGCVGIRVENTLPIKQAIKNTRLPMRKLKVMFVTEEQLQRLWLKGQGVED